MNPGFSLVWLRAALLVSSLCCTLPVLAETAASAAPVAQSTAPLLWTFRPSQQDYYINSLSVSDDGKKILAATFHHDYVRKYDPKEAHVPPLGVYGTYMLDNHGKVLWKDEFTAHEGGYWTALSARGNLAASSGWYSYAPRTGYVAIYDAANGRKLVDFRSARTRIAAVSFSADETLAVAGSDDVYLFERRGGRFDAMPIVVKLPDATPGDDRTDKVTRVAATRDGRLVLVTTISGRLLLIRHRAGSAQIIAQAKTDGPARTMVLSRNDRHVAVGAGSGKVHLFDLKNFAQTQAPIWTAAFDDAGAIFGVDISADGRVVAAVTNVGKVGRAGLLDNHRKPGQWLWQTALGRNPNAISLSRDLASVAVAEGYPGDIPGAFTMLDGKDGKQRWQHISGDMNWPIHFAEHANLCVGGSDDGLVYAFAVD